MSAHRRTRTCPVCHGLHPVDECEVLEEIEEEDFAGTDIRVRRLGRSQRRARR